MSPFWGLYIGASRTQSYNAGSANHPKNPWKAKPPVELDDLEEIRRIAFAFIRFAHNLIMKLNTFSEFFQFFE